MDDGAQVLASKKCQETYERFLQHPEAFWVNEARNLEWFRPRAKIPEWDPPSVRWFVVGRLGRLMIHREACQER